jgi:hypothetical protein
MPRQHGGEVELQVGPETFRCEGSAHTVETLFDKWQAAQAAPRRQQVVLRLGFHLKATRKGSTMEKSTIALELPDDSFVEVGIKLPLLDAGGNAIQNPDGSFWEPNIMLVSSDPAVALVEQAPGNAGKVYGQQLGQAVVTLTVPFPDGSEQVVDLLTSVLPSAPGPIQVEIGEAQKGEPTPA